MPFQSEKQRKYLWANEPEIAKRWEKYPKGYNTGGVSHLFRSKSAHGGYIRPEDSGVLGLAEGGKIIEGQPHNLAYITPGEAKTLQNLGGKKVMTPEGIPAYPPWDDPGASPGTSHTGHSPSGQDHRERPDVLSSPVSQPSYTPTQDDKGQDHAPPGEEGGPGYISPADLQTLKTNELKDIITRGGEEKKDYVKVPAHKSKFGKKWDRPEQYVTTGEAKTIAKLDAYVDKNFGMFSEFNMVKQVVNLLQDQVPLIGKFLPEFFPTTDIHGNVISSTDQVTGADLGFFQDKKWDYLWKKGPKDDDERDGDKGPIYDPLTGAVDEEFAQGEDMQGVWDPRDWMAEIRARQAIYQGLKSGWENQQLNSGGLANLFRVKNKY